MVVPVHACVDSALSQGIMGCGLETWRKARGGDMTVGGEQLGGEEAPIGRLKSATEFATPGPGTDAGMATETGDLAAQGAEDPVQLVVGFAFSAWGGRVRGSGDVQNATLWHEQARRRCIFVASLITPFEP